MTKLYFFKKKNTYFRKIIFFLISLFVFIALISYNALDSSLNVLSSEPIQNYCGKIGAIIADFLLQIYGLPVIPLFMFFVINSLISLIRREGKKNKNIFFAKGIFSILFLFFTSFILANIKSYQYKFQMLPGGYLGYWILTFFAKSPFLIKYFYLFFSFSLIMIFFSTIVIITGKIHLPLLLSFFVKKKQAKKNSLLSIFISKIIHFFLICFYRIKIAFMHHLKSEIKKTSKKSELSLDDNNISQISEDNTTKPLVEVLLQSYMPPALEFLHFRSSKDLKISDIELNDNMKKIGQILSDFAVRGSMMRFQQGPVVTLYEFKPDPGIKSSRIIGLADDLARIMKVQDVRIFIIPFKDTIGIEIPNKDRAIIDLRSLIESQEYQNSEFNIPIILGRDIFGKASIVDLTVMPHLLIAGTTGSGKSVGVNGMILSILYKLSPEKCRLIMIDPKMLEFSLYNNIPHLLMDVVTDPKKAIIALKWLVIEMEQRYQKMSDLGVRNITNYNEKVLQEDYMNYIVVFIDEMADLMLVAGKEIELLIQRLAQMARAAGIHLVMATQRPSVDVITGVIKANFPTRISYHVTSKIDSRTIIGEQGAERLLGKGDMLYMTGGSKITRIHGPFVLDNEIENISNYLKEVYPNSNYINLESAFEMASEMERNGNFKDSSSGDVYSQALEIVLNEKKTSISYLQRRLNIGYNKAANIIEDMERSGILSKPDISGKRIILKDS